MTRKIIWACLLLIPGVLNAQLTLKPSAGLNFTDWSKDVNGSFKAKAGWQLGGSVVFGKKLYLEPGLFYVGKSTEYQSADLEQWNNYHATINGFRIPVALGLHFLGEEGSLVGVRAFGGVSAFFLTGTNSDISKADLNNASFGTFAGAGVDVWKLFLDLSYEWSLTNIQKDVSVIDVGKSRTLFVNAGIRLGLGH